MAHLAVVVDGVALDEGAARAMWERFSAYMDEHRGDLAGFAAQEGYASARPAMGPDGALLELSSTAAQVPYRPVAGGSGGAGGPSAGQSGPARARASGGGKEPNRSPHRVQGPRAAQDRTGDSPARERPHGARRRGPARGRPGGGNTR